MKKRPLIGVFMDRLSTPYQIMIFEGIKAAIAKENCDLLCFEGSPVKSPIPSERAHNKVYDLAADGSIDGYLCLTSTIAQAVTRDEFKAFLAKFNSKPMVSIGAAIEGIPSVMEDNRKGFKELIEHLCVFHGLRRFAFIKGRENNQDAKERYEVFCEVLAAQGIPLIDELVLPGNFMTGSGIDAVQVLLDVRKRDFDVIVASNDYMAIGAVEELNRRGKTVPFDIAVTGFDGIDISALTNPPLTTVRQPLFGMGQTAVSLLSALMRGEKVPDLTLLPAELLVRDSCGCACLLKTADIRALNAHSLRDELTRICGRLAAVCRDNQESEESLLGLLGDLPGSIMALKEPGNESRFLKRIMEYLILPGITKRWLHLLKDCLLSLQAAFFGESSGPNDAAVTRYAFFKAISFIQYKEMELEQFTKDLFIDNQTFLMNLQTNLLFTLKLKNQLRHLEESLDDLGVDRFVLCLYQPKDGPTAYKYLTGVKNRRMLTLRPEDADQGLVGMLNHTITDDGGRYCLIVIPLQDFGFIVANVLPGHPGNFYLLFRDIISVPLRCALLFEELNSQRETLLSNLNTIRKAMAGFIETIAMTIEVRDPYTAGHQRRVSDLSRCIAQEMGCTEEEIECVRMAGIVHDLGKISVPSEILNKPGRLSEAEFTLIKLHPKVAYDILGKVEFPWPIADVVYQHHEKLDGSGYPGGLKAPAIRKEAKILCVADVVEAMASYRPYRPALGLDIALKEITDKRGLLYDTESVDACLKLFRENGYTLKV